MDPFPRAIPVTDGALLALRKTRFWVLFLGVVGVIVAIVCGIMALTGLFVLREHLTSGLLLVIEGGIFLVAFILLAVWQLGYSGALGKMTGDAAQARAALERAVIKQRNLWAVLAVFLLVFVVLGIASGIFFAFWGHHFFTVVPGPSYSG